MQHFIDWFNTAHCLDPLVKAAVAHLWFITIHPFDDGNGRIARAITDMQLFVSDGVNQRFFSMSSQISAHKKTYYIMLEHTQKGDLEISSWIEWFLQRLHEALLSSNAVIDHVVRKHQFLLKVASHSINERRRLMIHKMLDGFEGKLTSSKYAKIAKTSADTALRDINDLMQKGILLQTDAGGRSTSYELK